ncbi:hypothetical protein [Azospirillum sp. INR13]|nr:hypothetical protein [Azospirillum sp. INR13]
MIVSSALNGDEFLEHSPLPDATAYIPLANSTRTEGMSSMWRMSSG